jgi:hypothetical protein
MHAETTAARHAAASNCPGMCLSPYKTAANLTALGCLFCVPRHRCSPAEQHDAAAVAQLFKCGLVVWWRTSSLLYRLGMRSGTRRRFAPLPGARLISTRLVRSCQLFDFGVVPPGKAAHSLSLAEWHHHCGGNKAGIELGENDSVVPGPKGKG